jgi:hypothetical protein
MAPPLLLGIICFGRRRKVNQRLPRLLDREDRVTRHNFTQADLRLQHEFRMKSRLTFP